MQIETDIEIKYKTTLGDSFDGVELSDEEILEYVTEHIEEYCKEHNLDRCDIEILDVRKCD